MAFGRFSDRKSKIRARRRMVDVYNFDENPSVWYVFQQITESSCKYYFFLKYSFINCTISQDNAIALPFIYMIFKEINMVRTILKVESILTDLYQTTIPEVVRKVLHLGKRDKIHYIVQSDGHVFYTSYLVVNNKQYRILCYFLLWMAFLFKEISYVLKVR